MHRLNSQRQVFGKLQSELLESGVKPKHAQRITLELADHFEDLRLEALSQGVTAAQAQYQAEQRIGEQGALAERILEQTEFKTWIYRYPRVARIYLPVACALLLPVAPVFTGMANPTMVARWGAALMLGGTITAAMLLGMQLAIVLT